MRQLFENQHAVTALAQNIEYTSTSSGTFLKSGCRCTPNTTQTNKIVVDVESGSISLDTATDPVDVNAQSVELSPVPSNSDPNLTNARVDVINLTQNGASKVEGNVAVKRPTQAAPYNDEIEGQWPSLIAPRPDDGGLVNGVGRAVVYLDETVSDSTDITAAVIRNYDAFGQTAITEDTLGTAVENLTDPVAIEAQSAATFGGDPPGAWRRDYQSISLPNPSQPLDNDPGTADDISFYAFNVPAPPNHQLALYRVTLVSNGGDVPQGVSAEIERTAPSTGTEYSTTQRFSENDDGSPLVVVGSTTNPQLFRFVVQLANGAPATDAVSATFKYRITPSTNI